MPPDYWKIEKKQHFICINLTLFIVPFFSFFFCFSLFSFFSFFFLFFSFLGGTAPQHPSNDASASSPDPFPRFLSGTIWADIWYNNAPNVTINYFPVWIFKKFLGMGSPSPLPRPLTPLFLGLRPRCLGYALDARVLRALGSGFALNVSKPKNAYPISYRHIFFPLRALITF